jgi:hypothetical protein
MRITAIISTVLTLAAFSANAGTEIKLNSGTINTTKKVLTVTEANTSSEWIVQFQNHITEKTK